MNIHIDTAYKSLNKYGEELCGDRVEIVKTENSTIAVLADGLGSGVKANILSTLSSRIISTMMSQGADIREVVDTLVSTLPVCSVRKMAYCTFSIVQIMNDGEGLLIEFDNPFCVYLRDGKALNLPCECKEYSGKEIYETHFKVQNGDVLCIVSDGVIYAGVGETLNFGWTRESVENWLVGTYDSKKTAGRIAVGLSEAVDELYMGKPGDDSTVLVLKSSPEYVVSMFAGPPKNKDDDTKMVRDYMKNIGKKVICGGTSANIVARVLNREIRTSLDYIDPLIPPIGEINGIDLVTEGVLTMTRTVEILNDYLKDGNDAFYYKKLDEKNGASLLAKLLLEQCTKLKLYVGTAINPAHQNPNLPSDLSIKIKLIKEIIEIMEKLGRSVEICYY